ncbi:threonine/homoserine efflux transporter RhtA [Terrimicrobium sacchariphilum]|uniref:Threonine/homoserine efflux transporter RhtA n=1 Tax=Terrimicrobium sacchariphilum TaxID=690879 RepID=A0A146G9V9_TERSA|nr:DMT family transporter [Terrimicrobium sacchariphilum]GAT33428.1 threonine/homoserine efflux transporter RhtA [Terrimicrobium sacchariphilum]
MTTHRSTSAISTFLIVAMSSVLFCSKSVFAKLAYSLGADALTVLSLRMGFALPFFIAMVILGSRGQAPLTAAMWLKLAGLGFVGYYFSSLVNFTGLQYVSVGLERVILYTYPTLLLAFSALVLKKPVRAAVWLASSITWLGILAAFGGEMHNPVANGHAAFGAMLIFASAVSYGAFILLSGDTISRVGSMRFTGIAVGFSCVFILSHEILTRDITGLVNQKPAVYGYGLILAILGTVLPALLLSIGLKRAGAQRFAIISTVGPVTTFALAWAVLGERPNFAQLGGFLLTLVGGLGVSLLKESPNPAKQTSPDSAGSSGRRPA